MSLIGEKRPLLRLASGSGRNYSAGSISDDSSSLQTDLVVGNSHYFEHLNYTPLDERDVLRILDTRLFPWILLTTFVLNMDRTNISNAVSDNLPQDLGFTINTVNTATAIHSVLFSIFCLSGAVVAKIAGPARWIPFLMFSWGLVTLAHALITDKNSFIIVRSLIAITEGGVIPATLVYLGGFYKGTELATRLAWFWGIQKVASAVSGLMSSGLLHMRGILGLEGWKWLFIVDGIITLVVAVATWFYLPHDLAHTKGGLRGFNPWFTEKQVNIAVTRVVRDDISKRNYEKRVEWSDIKDTLTDIGIWGHLIITMIGCTPTTPMGTYLPMVIQSFDFNVFVANALTAPPYLLQCIVMIIFVHHSDKIRERGFHGAFGAGWQLLGWILLRALPAGTDRSIKYMAAVLLASWPHTHPLNIAWMSENTGSVGKRTVASGLIIGASNIYGVWGSQIYRADDAPDFKRGNNINIAFASVGFILWIAQKYMYRFRNARKAATYAQLSDQEQMVEDSLKESKGNRSLTFTFTT